MLNSGYSIPRFRAPYVALWLYSMVDKVALQALPLYGHKDNLDNSKVTSSFLFFLEKIFNVCLNLSITEILLFTEIYRLHKIYLSEKNIWRSEATDVIISGFIASN